MLGAIIGDILGSKYEFHNPKSESEIEFFVKGSTYTDDTVLSVATADVLMNGGDYSTAYTEYFKAYPHRGWGGAFKSQITTAGRLTPYNSYGNGSAMRVAPIGWYCNSREAVLAEAKRSAEVSHSHDEGIKGGQAIALAVFMARSGLNKDEVIAECIRTFGYEINSLESYPKRKFDVTCQGTIPVCMAIVREAKNFEDAMRISIVHGGDIDTNAAIVGSVAEALYGPPPIELQKKAFWYLDQHLKDTTISFLRKYVYKDYSIIPESASKEDKLMEAFKSLFN